MVIGVRRAMLWIGLISAAAFACTSAQNSAAAGAREAGTEACFNVRNVDSFSPLHAKFVYRVCSDTGARITFMDSGRRVFCRIIRVEAVARKEAAQKLVRDHTTPKAKG